MHVLSGIPNDHCHQLNGPGAYEWWYVDAVDAAGEWGVVLIMFRGMPMSPDYLRDPASMHGGYALSVYHRGVRLAFAFGGHPLSSCDYSSETPNIVMPTARFLADRQQTVMEIDAPCGADARRARVHVRMPAAGGHGTSPDALLDAHAWILAAARMQASITIEIDESDGPKVRHAFEALAYHDHNLGSRAMQSDFHDWYWGRVHARDATYVFLATRRSVDTMLWFGRVMPDGMVVQFHDVCMDLKKPMVSMFGLFHHRRIILSGTDESGRRHEVECSNGEVCEDGPFYQRYISSWRIGNDERAFGMSEYMNVHRLSKPWIRPFLRLPWMVSS